MKKLQCLLLFLFCMTTFLSAQQVWSGRITDTKGIAIPYAAVALLNRTDSSLISAVATDTAGWFRIQAQAEVKAILQVSCFGYEPAQLPLEKGIAGKSLPDITLAEKSIGLEEVVVTGVKPTLTKKADRFSFHIEGTEIVKGNTTWDVLKQTPMIQTSDEGSVSIIGKGEITVYLNGKKNKLSGQALQSLLKSIPADQIQQIEIITSLNSTFRASDTAGAINIILKKNDLEGWMGSVLLADNQTDHRNSQNGSLYLNYKKNKLDLSANLFGRNKQTLLTHDYLYRYLQSDLATAMRTSEDRTNLSYGGQISADYRPDDRQVIGVVVNTTLHHNDNQVHNHSLYSPLDRLAQIDSLSKGNRKTEADGYEIGTNFNYRLLTDGKGSYFNLDLDFLHYKDKSYSSLLTHLYDPSDQYLGPMQDIRQRLPQLITNIAGKAEYRQALRTSDALTGGIEVYSTRSDADSYQENKVGETYQADLSLNNRFIYTETVSALYLSYDREWSKKWSSTLGARLEYTRGVGKLKQSADKNFTRDNWNIFPSVMLNYAINSRHNLSLAVTSGIERPAFSTLNPARQYTSATTYRENNPFLKAVRSLQGELSYTLLNKFIFISSYTVQYNFWTLFQRPVIGTPYIRTLYDNYGNFKLGNLSVIWNDSFFNGAWRVNYFLAGYYMLNKGSVEDIQIDTRSLTGYLSFTNIFTLSRRYDWGATFQYFQAMPQELAGCKRKANSFVDLRIRKGFGNHTLSLDIHDIFRKQTYRDSYTYDDLSYRWKYNLDSRVFSLTYSYRFGNQKVKGARNRQTNQAIQNRVGN